LEIALHDKATDPYLEPTDGGSFRFHADITCDLHNFLGTDELLTEEQRHVLVGLWEDPEIDRQFEQENGFVLVRLKG
jgi:hypothetical protein